jgi:hypothetical protein
MTLIYKLKFFFVHVRHIKLHFIATFLYMSSMATGCIVENCLAGLGAHLILEICSTYAPSPPTSCFTK